MYIYVYILIKSLHNKQTLTASESRVEKRLHMWMRLHMRIHIHTNTHTNKRAHTHSHAHTHRNKCNLRGGSRRRG